VKRLLVDSTGESPPDGTVINVVKKQKSVVRGPKSCGECGHSISWRERETHEEVCPAVIIDCCNGCGTTCKRGLSLPPALSHLNEMNRVDNDS